MELNKLLTTIGQFQKVYVRKFATHKPVHDKERSEWKKKFNKEKVLDLQAYTHRFYFSGNLREGNYRLCCSLPQTWSHYLILICGQYYHTRLSIAIQEFHVCIYIKLVLSLRFSYLSRYRFIYSSQASYLRIKANWV